MQKIVKIEIKSNETQTETLIKSEGITKEELADMLINYANSLYIESQNYTIKYDHIKNLES